MKYSVKIVALASFALASGLSLAQQGETVKIAHIDPLTGLMGPVGNNQLNSFKYFAEQFSKNNPAGVKFEMVSFDNKLSPAESLNALKAAIDQGVRYIAQGNGSSVAGALIEAVAKHNERNPGKEVVFLNYAAVDPDFTNSKCNYWHFRFDADTSMKMEALTSFIKDQPDVKKVFLLNQNYSHGQQVSKYAKEMLARKRPDVQIVGDDLHPLAQVRDFAPYVAKIKASGADSVITGNWGSDLALLIKAANEGGYTGKFFTYYTGVTGTPLGAGQERRWAGLPGGLQPLQHGRPDGQVDGRLQEPLQGRHVHRRGHPCVQRPRRRHGQGQVHRPGQGRGRDGGHALQELQRRGRDAQDRPPAPAAAVHHRLEAGRQEVPLQPGKHRHDAGAGQGIPGLRGQHAHQLPDEAPLMPVL